MGEHRRHVEGCGYLQTGCLPEHEERRGCTADGSSDRARKGTLSLLYFLSDLLFGIFHLSSVTHPLDGVSCAQGTNKAMPGVLSDSGSASHAGGAGGRKGGGADKTSDPGGRAGESGE